jgi:hypothetical protein
MEEKSEGHSTELGRGLSLAWIALRIRKRYAVFRYRSCLPGRTLVDCGVTGHLSSLPHADRFGPGSRQLFTATVNQKVTYGLPTTRQQCAVLKYSDCDYDERQ